MSILRRSGVGAWALTLGAVLLALVILFDLIPWVRGGYGWRWEYDPARSLPVFLALFIAGYIGVGAWLLNRRARPRWFLLVGFIAAALIPILAVSLRGDVLYTLFSRIFSEVASHHMVGAASVNWTGGEWRDWPAVMARIGSHVGTSPPALLLAYGLVTDIADKTGLAAPLSSPLIAALCTDYKLYDFTAAEIASGWLGVLYPVWAAFAVFPLYRLSRDIGGKRPEAVVLLWPLVPALSGFAASNSTLFPIFALLMALPLVGKQTRWRAGCAGLFFGLATFTNLALLPLVGFAGYFVLARWFFTRPRPSFLHPVMLGVAFGVGALIPWAVWWLFTGDTPLDILRQSLSYHLELDRPYWFWVWFHVFDWALWGGLAFIVTAGVLIRRRWTDRVASPDAAALGVALVLTVFTLTVSGITRGESGRIWLFLTPFALAFLSTLDRWRWLHLAIGQSVLTLALIFAVDAFNAPDVPAAPFLLTADSSAQSVERFAENGVPSFAILAYDARLDNEMLNLSLTISGIQPPLTPAWFGMVLVAPDGTVTPSEPLQPLDPQSGERHPATCWASEKTATVVLSQPLDAPLPNGDGYYISLSVYDYRANGAVWTLADGAETQIGLGPFTLGHP